MIVRWSLAHAIDGLGTTAGVADAGAVGVGATEAIPTGVGAGPPTQPLPCDSMSVRSTLASGFVRPVWTHHPS